MVSRQSPKRGTAFLQSSSINLNTEAAAWKAWLPLLPLGPVMTFGALCAHLGRGVGWAGGGRQPWQGSRRWQAGVWCRNLRQGQQMFSCSLVPSLSASASSYLRHSAGPGHSCLHLPLQDPEGSLGPSWAGPPSSPYSTAPQKRQRQAGKRGGDTTMLFNEAGTLSPSSSSSF